MSASGWIQSLLYVAVLLAITKPLGVYLYHVLDVNGKTFLDPLLRPVERLLYKLFGVNPQKEHDWKQYCVAMLMFSMATMVFTYAILRLQGHFPWHQYVDALSDKTRSQCGSFVQYGGKLYDQHQLAELRRRKHHVVFLADGGPGIAQLLVGGGGHRDRRRVGARHCQGQGENDRQFLGGPGPHPSLSADSDLHRLCDVSGFPGDDRQLPPDQQRDPAGSERGSRREHQTSRRSFKVRWRRRLPSRCWAPTAAGIINANASHPFENPTPLSNFIQILSIFAIPSALTYYLGRMVKNQGHGWAVWAAMVVVFFGFFLVCWWSEARGNPRHG